MKRRILVVDAKRRSYRLETIRPGVMPHDEREAYLTLHGEAMCQYVLRRDPGAMVIARGPLVFLAGNKATVGYVSPVTGVPHYSFVGGRAAAQLFALGLDAIVLTGVTSDDQYLTISGRAPELSVTFREGADLPTGQRSAYYDLVERELGGNAEAGSVFTLGKAVQHGYLIANLAVEAQYHAGRGGAGTVFGRFLRAMVLCGPPVDRARFFASTGADPAFARSPNRSIAQPLARYTARLSGRTGGTIVKLYDTGANPPGHNTLPSRNASRMGYELADLGAERFLSATRDGHTGCHWCPVDCRHWHWVEAEYAPGGKDRFLDDFEPTYAILSMLGLTPAEDSLQAKVDFLRDVNRQIIVPVEQMGCDIIDVGVGLAALLEGLERGLIPADHVPPELRDARMGGYRAVVTAIELLRVGVDGDAYPALRAIGDGPQALAQRYPATSDIVYTCGKGTMGNAGHSNALWTFMMPFSRYFGHYSGQIYKIDEHVMQDPDDESLRRLFGRVVSRMLDREVFGILCNALSCCAFTFVIFGEGGQGEELDQSDLLVRTLHQYGIRTTREDLLWFAQAFWAQSMDLKARYGWRPPRASGLPRRVFEGLSLVLEQPPDELQRWMDMLIAEWKRQAEQMLLKFGYDPAWLDPPVTV